MGEEREPNSEITFIHGNKCAIICWATDIFQLSLFVSNVYILSINHHLETSGGLFVRQDNNRSISLLNPVFRTFHQPALSLHGIYILVMGER